MSRRSDLRQRHPLHAALVIVVLPLFLVGFTGCTSTPTLKSPLTWKNPFAGPPPAYKSQYGLTPKQKVDRLRALAESAGGMDLSQQSTFSRELTNTLRNENDPLLRCELVRTLGTMASPEANEGLRWGMDDENTRVRIAACEAWGRRNDPEAVGLLSAVLAEDDDVDVRLAASQSLARRPGGESLEHLAATLEDRDPAVQLATMQSLRQATGANLGNDVNEWLAYLNTQSGVIGSPVLPVPSRPDIPNAPYQSDATAQLVSGLESASKAAAPVYEDVTSGASIYH